LRYRNGCWTTAFACAVVSCDKSSNNAPPPAAHAATAAAVGTPSRWRPTTRPDFLDPGDLLGVRVLGLTADTVRTEIVVHVQADGTVALPLLAGPVPVAGVDRTAAARRIGDAYHRANVLSKADVEIRRLAVAAGDGRAGAVVGNYDLLRCEIQQLESGTRATVAVGRVDGRGMLSAPLIAPVHVAGLTEAGVAAALGKGYHDANILSEPQVSVVVLERAPDDAAHKSLPDGPIDPVPFELRELFLPR
jgi:protein involved in polysaccharide export with SLBB domain